MASLDIAGQVEQRACSRVSVAIADLLAGLKLWELWSTLGWHDIRQRYRRSIVGPFWLVAWVWGLPAIVKLIRRQPIKPVRGPDR